MGPAVKNIILQAKHFQCSILLQAHQSKIDIGGGGAASKASRNGDAVTLP